MIKTIPQDLSIAHRNHLYLYYQQNKSSASKVKFIQISNCYERVLEKTKVVYANTTKQSINSRKLDFCDFY